jgi:hypothetical protein
MRRVAAACAVISGAILLIGTALPAQAAAPGWRQMFSKHYGPASSRPFFDAVVASSAHDAWALGGTTGNDGDGPMGTPVAEHWNGKAWSQYNLPRGVADHIIAASAPAGNDIWAVTQFGGYILHWNGKAWSLAKRLPAARGPLAPQLTGVVALSAKNVWVFGGSGETVGWGTWHYNGKSWTLGGGYSEDISNGSAVSAASIWAIGGLSAPQSQIVHYTGTWKPVTSRTLSGLSFGSIQAFNATDVWATAVPVSTNAPSYLVHYNGRVWSKVKVPWNVGVGWSPVVSDGHGGLWLSSGSVSQNWEVHRTAKGAWGRNAVGVPLTGLANVPGTGALLGAGAFDGKITHDAVVWAYGAV